jgi:hypothetical protein
MNKLALVAILFAAACSGGDEDYEIDGYVFGADAEGKEDSTVAGIRENSFKAMGVLNAAATLDVAGWKTVTGISTTLANKLVAAQSSNGWGRSGLPSLKALTKLGLSATAIGKLATYAQSHQLVPGTAIKIPVQDDNGAYLYTKNGDMREAHLPFFSKFMYLWDGGAGTAQYAYFYHLGERASDRDIEAYPMTGAGIMAGDGSVDLCYTGDMLGVVSAVEAGTSALWTEMLMIWGWRAGTTTDVSNWDEQEMLDSMYDDDDRAAWENYDTSSKTVLMATTQGDGGEDLSLDWMSPCQ